VYSGSGRLRSGAAAGTWDLLAEQSLEEPLPEACDLGLELNGTARRLELLE